jgi:hypothetical protein
LVLCRRFDGRRPRGEGQTVNSLCVTIDELFLTWHRFRTYLVENGWDGEMGEEDLKGVAEDGQTSSDRILTKEVAAGDQKTQ